MSVPKKRKTKSAVRTKRSHASLKKKRLIPCSHCQRKIAAHRACPFCGYYRDKEVLEIKMKKEKKKKKKEKKEKEK